MADQSAAAMAFDRFWDTYHHKVKRGRAEAAWRKVKPAEWEAIIVAANAWRVHHHKTGKLAFLPHPASWLNDRRWEDEVMPGEAPVPPKAQAKPADHSPHDGESYEERFGDGVKPRLGSLPPRPAPGPPPTRRTGSAAELAAGISRPMPD